MSPFRLSYVAALLPGAQLTSETQLYASLILTAVTMFILGAVKGTLVSQTWWDSGLKMTVNGCVAAFLGWAIGYLLANAGLKDIA